jgi:hypothetical protein
VDFRWIILDYQCGTFWQLFVVQLEVTSLEKHDVLVWTRTFVGWQQQFVCLSVECCSKSTYPPTLCMCVPWMWYHIQNSVQVNNSQPHLIHHHEMLDSVEWGLVESHPSHGPHILTKQSKFIIVDYWPFKKEREREHSICITFGASPRKLGI